MVFDLEINCDYANLPSDPGTIMFVERNGDYTYELYYGKIKDPKIIASVEAHSNLELNQLLRRAWVMHTSEGVL